MSQIRNEMQAFEDELNDLLGKHSGVSGGKFPLSEYKSLSEKLIETHIKMASPGGIDFVEGSIWFREQVKKMTDFIP